MELFFWKYFKVFYEYNIANRNIVQLVEEIGKQSKNLHGSDWKKGVMRIQRFLHDNKGFNVSKREIKTFIMANRNNRGIIKIPYTAYPIFEAITTLIHKNEDSLSYCKKCIVRNLECKSCRESLIQDYFELLDTVSRHLTEKAHNVYAQFKNCTYTCSPKP